MPKPPPPEPEGPPRDLAVIEEYRRRWTRDAERVLPTTIGLVIITLAVTVAVPFLRKHLIIAGAVIIAVIAKAVRLTLQISPRCPACELGRGIRAAGGGRVCSHCRIPLTA